MVAKRIAWMFLLLVTASAALSAGETPPPQVAAPEQGAACPALEAELAIGQELTDGAEALPPLSPLDTAVLKACTQQECEVRCGGCGRLRGCWNNIPFCECFHC